MTAQVNGKRYSWGVLDSMYWSLGEYIAYASRGTRVVPGDVIGSGTVGGGCIQELARTYGPAAYPWLQPGDEVGIGIRLGWLEHRVVAGPPLRPLRPGGKPRTAGTGSPQSSTAHQSGLSASTARPGPGTASLTEIAPGVFAYLQPDGSWFINNTGLILGEDQVLSIDTCATEARTRAYLAAIRTAPASQWPPWSTPTTTATTPTATTCSARRLSWPTPAAASCSPRPAARHRPGCSPRWTGGTSPWRAADRLLRAPADRPARR